MLYVYVKRMSHPRVTWEGTRQRAGDLLNDTWGGIRWAGEGIAGLDAQYAGAVGDLIRQHTQPGVKRAFLEASSGSPLGEGYNTIQADSNWERALGIGNIAGFDAMNIASRYALPAGGVTLAGKGIADLTALMINADGQQPGELSL